MHKLHDGVRAHCLGCGQHSVVEASSCLQSCLILLYDGCLLHNSVTLETYFLDEGLSHQHGNICTEIRMYKTGQFMDMLFLSRGKVTGADSE